MLLKTAATRNVGLTISEWPGGNSYIVGDEKALTGGSCPSQKEACGLASWDQASSSGQPLWISNPAFDILANGLAGGNGSPENQTNNVGDFSDEKFCVCFN